MRLYAEMLALVHAEYVDPSDVDTARVEDHFSGDQAFQMKGRAEELGYSGRLWCEGGEAGFTVIIPANLSRAWHRECREPDCVRRERFIRAEATLLGRGRAVEVDTRPNDRFSYVDFFHRVGTGWLVRQGDPAGSAVA